MFLPISYWKDHVVVLNLQSWPLPALAGGLGLCALIIGIVGIRLTRRAEEFALVTGLGEALIGGILLGAVTSLSGIVTSATAAYDGAAGLSFSNAVGGIAAQTAFLAIADMFHRRANLEHSAASPVNLFQAALLSFLLPLPLFAKALPDWSIAGLHPVSLLLPTFYLFGQRISQVIHEQPMWKPRITRTTRAESAPDGTARSLSSGLVLSLLVFALVIGVTGWFLSQLAEVLAVRTGLRGGVIGALLTATITSLPELVTSVAAVRRGALQLAVGGIIGGNTFDILFLPVSDGFYRSGSLYHAIDWIDAAWILLALPITALLQMGLIRREPRGVGGIGFEGAGILLLYVFGAISISLAV